MAEEWMRSGTFDPRPPKTRIARSTPSRRRSQRVPRGATYTSKESFVHPAGRDSSQIGSGRLARSGQKKPRQSGAFAFFERPGHSGCASIRGHPGKLPRYALMSTSLVSGKKINATTKLIVAMMIGYHRPE